MHFDAVFTLALFSPDSVFTRPHFHSSTIISVWPLRSCALTCTYSALILGYSRSINHFCCGCFVCGVSMMAHSARSSIVLHRTATQIHLNTMRCLCVYFIRAHIFSYI